MKYFSAIYEQGATRYSSFIYAQDKEAAVKMVKQRNIGEQILGEHVEDKDFTPHPLPSAQYVLRELIQCVHTLTYYSWIASKAGVIDPADDVLSDKGVLHEILHEMQHPEVYGFRENIRERLAALEMSIPGLVSYNPAMTSGISSNNEK